MTDAIPAKAGTIGRRAGELLLTIGIILSGLPLAAFADGGTLRLSETKRPYRISVLTSPNPFRAGPVDISVIVADAATGDVLPDVKVDLHLAPCAAVRRATISSNPRKRGEQAVSVRQLRVAAGRFVERPNQRRGTAGNRSNELRDRGRRPATPLAQPVALVQLAVSRRRPLRRSSGTFR